ncbi:MAG: hypothetical protein IPK16_21340 [Anaerolineales bacterium]|nr:hypothetical protein [Anaerolineales bacterium]
MAVLLLYLLLACYQLELPGLHYDEAKEAGVNAMEMLTGAPISAFRGAGIAIGGRTYPLMVQDYIGALNVYLALPLLGLTGVGVPNLRILPVLTGLAALILLERAVSEWVRRSRAQGGLSSSGLIAITLLAAAPSFVFWARQGIFVTNLTLPFVFLCIWQGLRWLRTGSAGALIAAALAGGLAIYAKLIAVWVVAPFAVLAGGWWLVRRWRIPEATPRLAWRSALLAMLAFLAPLTPLLLFNWQSGGTLTSVGSNLRQSYYGVENANVLGNLAVRANQVVQSLRGNFFWYLGGLHANGLAPWLALVALIAGLWRDWRRVLPPLILTGAAFGASLFTISDLFITHYALIEPLIVGTVAIALGSWLEGGQRARINRTGQAGVSGVEPSWRGRSRIPAFVVSLVVVLWLVADLAATVQYHGDLARSGGLADHSDANYHLAYHLQYNGMGAPIALDWGMDAPVRYLTNGAVTPIEIFGYATPERPDSDFQKRLALFLPNVDNRYLLHAPNATVFRGRRSFLVGSGCDWAGKRYWRRSLGSATALRYMRSGALA